MRRLAFITAQGVVLSAADSSPDLIDAHPAHRPVAVRMNVPAQCIVCRPSPIGPVRHPMEQKVPRQLPEFQSHEPHSREAVATLAEPVTKE